TTLTTHPRNNWLGFHYFTYCKTFSFLIACNNCVHSNEAKPAVALLPKGAILVPASFVTSF
ncbi:hypothetical protein WAH63_21840, partial [Acinetobacter baumannii]